MTGHRIFLALNPETIEPFTVHTMLEAGAKFQTPILMGMWTERAGDSSPSQPTYVGESEIYVQTLDVVQTFK